MFVDGQILLPRSITFSPIDLTLPEIRQSPVVRSDIHKWLSESAEYELTNCSPVLSHEAVVRIRNNVLAQYRILYTNYSSIGGSLDATGLMNQYQAVWDVAEGGSYCTYQSDAAIGQEILGYLNGANTIFQNDANQFANNFAAKLSPLRSAFLALQSASSQATNDIAPAVNALNALAASNFQFNLYQGMSSYLDSLLSDYEKIMNSAGSIFDQAEARVQANFEAAFKSFQKIYSNILGAVNTWDKADGFNGYTQFSGLIPVLQNELSGLSKFVVLKKPVNDQIMSEIDYTINEVKKSWAAFPTYPQFTSSSGAIFDPGTSIHKSYARQLVLNLTQAIGAHFISTIAKGQSLIVTGLSYQHGGKMPPHQEHKDGRDCDMFSSFFKLSSNTFDKNKTVATIVFLLNRGVSRVIFSSDEVVNAANAAVPSNPVAVNRPGHDTHIHFDTEVALAELLPTETPLHP